MVDSPTGEVRSRRLDALKQGGPLWAWPVLGVVLVAVAGQQYGRGGALLVAGVGAACFVLVGSQLLFGGQVRLYASGAAFCAGVVVVVLALVQPVAEPGEPNTAGELPARPANQDLLARPTLAGVDLGGADLRGFTLSGESLDGADLAGANLRGATLSGASMRGADLRGADLRESCLERVDLRGALLDGVLATGADTTDAVVTIGGTARVIGWAERTGPGVCG